MDRMLEVNTAKTRTLSLARQAYLWFELMPTMPEERLSRLLAGYHEEVRARAAFRVLFVGEAE